MREALFANLRRESREHLDGIGGFRCVKRSDESVPVSGRAERLLQFAGQCGSVGKTFPCGSFVSSKLEPVFSFAVVGLVGESIPFEHLGSEDGCHRFGIIALQLIETFETMASSRSPFSTAKR